jgi:MoaA/NifB/PqqE/SkfB family radical SAM enzyme
MAQVVVTRRCNLDCGYCNEYDKTSPPVATETVKRWVDKLAELSCLVVEYTGGETLLHPDIVELVRHAAALRFPSVRIITNGYLLTAELIDRLNDAGLDHLQISIDGLAPSAITVKTLRPLRRKLELLAARARFRVQVNSVLGAGDPADAVEVARFARELGLRPRVCVLHDERGGLALGAEARRALLAIEETVGRRWREAGDYRNRLLAEGRAPFKCRAGSRYLYVDEFGLVNWCSQQRGVFTKPLLDYDWNDLREQFYLEKACAPTCTVGCVRTVSSFDEWRSQPAAARSVTRAPAVNEDQLIPATALRPRLQVARRSQTQWRNDQLKAD